MSMRRKTETDRDQRETNKQTETEKETEGEKDWHTVRQKRQ